MSCVTFTFLLNRFIELNCHPFNNQNLSSKHYLPLYPNRGNDKECYLQGPLNCTS